MSPSGALDRLKKGNARYREQTIARGAEALATRRAELVAGQAPFAAVLGCADSRVPPEVVFDQSLGDLFVVRVAGNVAGPSQVGSIEYAVDPLGVGLIVVLGHTGCGAVKAALDSANEADDEPVGPSGGSCLGGLVRDVRAGIAPAIAASRDASEDDLLGTAVEAGVRTSVERLRAGPESFGRRCVSGELDIVGAVYSLETGHVNWLDDETA